MESAIRGATQCLRFSSNPLKRLGATHQSHALIRRAFTSQMQHRGHQQPSLEPCTKPAFGCAAQGRNSHPRHNVQRCLNTSRRIHVDSLIRTLSDSKAGDTSPKENLYQMSVSLSRIPMNGNAEVLCTVYNTDGAVTSTSKLTKTEISHRYGLSTRDLRSIDLPSAGLPHMLIREHFYLLQMFDLRLLVQADQVVRFHVEEAEAAGHEQNYTTSRVFSDQLPGKLNSDRGVSTLWDMPYEMRVLEAALSSVMSTLEAEYLLARRQVTGALQTLDEDSIIHSELRKLLELVREIAGIEQRARHVCNAVQEVLNDDQDMAELYLSDTQAGKPHAIQDHQDVEYLLEAFQKSSDALVQHSGSLLRDIRRTEETVQSILNVRRNQIMVLEAKIEIIMVGLACATLVAGWYGMNVVNYFEESELAFGVLTVLSLVGTAVVWRVGLSRLRRIQKVRL